MITESEFIDRIARDHGVAELLAMKKVSDGWMFLIRTSYTFPKFEINWTDGESFKRILGCGIEETARQKWELLKGGAQ